ncbi:2-isopropylmalate synthase [Gossypium arboreum]|uniref:2-isopropylmalate synthase n=1 Tax=Gossypium arboreum TaxID=29729 RepID=A0A0B0NAY0_GOSAR|nr:2-isopropylmalate synthase [Gossypium arboreum]
MPVAFGVVDKVYTIHMAWPLSPYGRGNLTDRTWPSNHVTWPSHMGVSLFQRVVFYTEKGT